MNSNFPFINIHTHKISDTDVSILNVSDIVFLNPHQQYVSIGLHPWTINKVGADKTLELIRERSKDKNVVAIGECGLDKLIDVDFHLQEKLFREQISIAEKVQKPIIIHCVKAFDDLIRIKKEMKIAVPLIVHGYNNNIQIANELIKNGFYISLGNALLNMESNASKVISTIPVEHLFLETDDSDFTIKELYESADKHLRMDIELLKQLVYKNYIKIFIHE